MKSIRLLCLFLVLLSSGLTGVRGQALPLRLRFNSVGERDGLTSPSVQCLLQDHQGFIWAGTQDGVVRYDGGAFQLWRHRRSDSMSLGHNTILTMGEDPQGRIWMGTNGGVSCLDAARERFRVWKHRDGDTTTLSQDYDNRVLVTRTGAVWVGNGSGLSRYDARRDCWTRVRLPGDKGLLAALYEDRQGRLWLGTAGLIRVYDPVKKRLVASLTLPLADGQPMLPISFFQDHQHRIWLTTWGAGLVLLDPTTGHHRTFVWDLHPPVAGVSNIVLQAAETRNADNTYTLWLATNIGLMRFDEPQQGQNWPSDLHAAPLYQHQPADPATLLSSSLTSVLTTSEGTVWIGTANGLSWLIPRHQVFGVLPLSDGKIGGTWASQFLADRDPMTHRRCYWVTSWYGDGLALYDSAFRYVRAWPRLPVGSSEYNAGQMGTLIRSHVDSQLWIATFDGLVRFDPATGATRVYRGSKTDTSRTSLRYFHLTHVYEDRLGRLWMAAWRRGIYLLTDRERGLFRHYGPEEGMPFDIAHDFTEDANGRFWIGGEGGLVRLDPAAPKGWRVYRHEPNNPRSLPHSTINELWADPDGRLWVATREGIGIWHPESDEFESITSLQGLPSDEVFAMRPDRDGHLWFTTSRGLVRSLGARGPFQLFNQSSGLPQSDVTGRFDTLADGRFIIGMTGRAMVINPAAYTSNRVPPPVVITEVRLLDQPLRLGRPLDVVPLLELEPRQNTLTFSYAALNYSNPHRNRYFYRLDGVHDDWVAAGSRRYATFANLPGGDYTFRVRATNDDGVLSTREAIFRFHIRRPFTQTPFFWTLIAVSGLFLVRARVRAIRREADRQLHISREMADLESRALRAQMNPHFVFNSLNAIQELVVTGRAEAASRYLTRFARLLRLVLEHAERPYVPLEEELTALRLYLDIESLRLEGLQYDFSIDPELELAEPNVPAMVVQPYLENALWHGLAPRPAGQRKLYLTFALTPDEAAVLVTIEDSGIGRAAAAQRRARRHHSMGQRLTERRLQLLGAEMPPPEFEDLVDKVTELPTGTRVSIWLSVER